MVDLFSAWLSMSLENHSLNSSCESNNVGIMKCSRAQSWKQRKNEIAVEQQKTVCEDIMRVWRERKSMKVAGMCVMFV